VIAIVDYRMGNLRSVQKGFEHAGIADAHVTDDSEVVAKADGIVLPGVGAFRDASRNLAESGMRDAILGRVAEGVPFLGICLGLQLLADIGLEQGEWEGLGLVHGRCERLPSDVKVPHMGWNTIEYPRTSQLFDGIEEGSAFYFVHSYYLNPDDDSCIIGSATYGVPFAAAVQVDNVFGVQFHPEKSSEKGLHMLANFGRLVSKGA